MNSRLPSPVLLLEYKCNNSPCMAFSSMGFQGFCPGELVFLHDISTWQISFQNNLILMLRNLSKSQREDFFQSFYILFDIPIGDDGNGDVGGRRQILKS